MLLSRWLSTAEFNYPCATVLRLSTAASSNTILLSQMVIEIFENFHSFVGPYVGLRRDHTTTAAHLIDVADEVCVIADMLTVDGYPATIALADDGVRITPTCDDIPAYFTPFKTIGNEPPAPLARAS
jgi:hypothetical protein